MSDVNYNIAPQNPLPGMMQALQLGSALGGIRDQREQAQAQAEAARIAAEQKAARDAQISDLFKLVHENPSAENYTKLSNMMPPEQAKSIREGFTMLDESTQKTKLSEAAQVLSAFKSGNTEIALNMLQQNKEAYKNAGNEKAANQAQLLIDMANNGEVGRQGVEDFFGLTIAQMPGGKDAIDAVVKFSEEQRAENLDKIMAKSPGQLKPKEVADFELALNKEYTTRTKGFTDALRLDSVIKDSAADASGAGDLALVTTFMKMLDPGSVVRESEFAAAQDTSGLLGKLMSSATKIQNGQILTPQQRTDFARLAGQYMTASATHEKKARKDLEFMVNNYGLNKENVFGTMADGSLDQSAKNIPNVDIAALKAFVKSQRPASEHAQIDALDAAGLKREFPKTVAKYGQPVVEPIKQGGF